MSTPHSIWPVVLIPYNLPPWQCMKDPYFMMTLLIPGPKCPENDIDVYLQPLIEELKELWDIGVETYDAHTRQNFNLHVAVLWTINDFFAYGNLSGWMTKGKLACPCCHKDALFQYEVRFVTWGIVGSYPKIIYGDVIKDLLMENVNIEMHLRY